MKVEMLSTFNATSRENDQISNNMAEFEERNKISELVENENISVLETNTLDLEEGLDEYLVEEVRNYRILWDTSTRGYKDTPKKNLAWAEISRRLNQNSTYINMYKILYTIHVFLLKLFGQLSIEIY